MHQVHNSGRRAVFAASHLRSERIRRNIQSSIPEGAQLSHLGSTWGDNVECIGCGLAIEHNDLAYQLEFRRNREIATIKLHRECWESWRIDEAPVPAPWDSSVSSSGFPHRLYVCTERQTNITCNEYPDLRTALSVLKTFLVTARRMGYRIARPAISGHMGGKFVAHGKGPSVSFWISETDESRPEARRASNHP